MSHGNKDPKPPPANPAIQQVNTPTPAELYFNKRFGDWTNWESQTGPKDILDAPGMGDMLDIYGSADSLANQRRLGNPGMALSGGGSGDYARQVDSQTKQNMYDQRAEGLSHGLQGLKSEAYGLGGSAADLETNRKRSYADLMLDQQERYYNRPKRPSMFERIAGLAIQGLGAAGAAGGTAGLAGL